MSFRPQTTSRVAAGAVLAAIWMVAFGGVDDGNDRSAPIVHSAVPAKLPKTLAALFQTVQPAVRLGRRSP